MTVKRIWNKLIRNSRVTNRADEKQYYGGETS